MALSEIVQVSISLGTASPARRGFGQALFIAPGTEWTDGSVRRYAGYSAVLEDFTDPDSPEALAALAFFSQSPRPPYFKIARMSAPASADCTFVLDGTNIPSGTTVAGTITMEDGTVNTVSVAWDTNLATTLTAVEAAIEAFTGITSSTTATAITFSVDTNGEVAFVDFSATPGMRVRETTADWDIDDALTTVATVDPDFYGVACPTNSPKNMDKVARWALANDRIALFAPQYTDPGQFVSGEFTSGSDLTALQANDAAVGLFTKQDRSAFMEVAWAAKMFAKDPGSATWAFKSLSGVVADAWTSSERAAIEALGGNHYSTEAAIDITRPGKTFGGEWVDVKISLDWLTATLQENLFALFASQDKVPYTDEGGALIEAEVRGVLRDAERRGILDSGWTVTVPLVADQTSGDRSARIFRGVEFSARLAGAVHSVLIAGTVTE